MLSNFLLCRRNNLQNMTLTPVTYFKWYYTQTYTAQQWHESHLQQKMNIPCIFCGVNLNSLTNKISFSCEGKNIICKITKWWSLGQRCQIQYWYHQLHKHKKNQNINYRNLDAVTQEGIFSFHTSVTCSGRVGKSPCGGSDCWQDTCQ